MSGSKLRFPKFRMSTQGYATTVSLIVAFVTFVNVYYVHKQGLTEATLIAILIAFLGDRFELLLDNMSTN
jgi:hypothetical protein